MELIIRKRDIRFALVACGILGSALAYAYHDASAMRRELEGIAQEKIDEWFEGDESARANSDYLALVDSGKAFHVFGRGWGVIHVYFRDKGDVDMTSFKGVEYYFVREDETWTLLDSAGCGAMEHHLRAFEEFHALGHDVPERVFHKALGIDPKTMQAGHDHDHEHGDHEHSHEPAGEGRGV